MNDLKQRGVEDILFACVEGLKGFPGAIKSAFPHTSSRHYGINMYSPSNSLFDETNS